jgi:PAS domain S-box-containing protein
VRRLTYVAGRIQEGDIASRAGIGGSDEVATLGSAFDSMVDSVEEQTMALRTAADEESRLRNRLEAVVAGMGDGLVATDAAGLITDFNVAAEELTGVVGGEAVGRDVDQIVKLTADDGKPIDERIRRPGPGRWTALGTLGPRYGGSVPVAVSVGALRGPEGELTGSVLVLRDLRREREIERMKTEFLSRVGHELRTPLTGILGYADILLRRPVPPERARVWHEEILAGSKRLLRIVEMLEFFASSGAGRMLLRAEPVELSELIPEVLAGWERRLPSTHTLVPRLSAPSIVVTADRRWLALALDELIDNAVKFSPLGGRVLVSAAPARPRSSNGLRPPWVELAVTDRGMGMTPEEQASAFGEFVQGDASDTRRYGGLGLGLALVQRVSQGLGGRVSCRSTPGRGSTVIIRLPSGDGPVPTPPADRTTGHRAAIR